MESLIKQLYSVIHSDPNLTSRQAIEIFEELDRLKVKELYCIIIHHSKPPRVGEDPYIKFCLRKDLGCRVVEKGLFTLHASMKNLKVMMLNQKLDWITAIQHLPCTYDLAWNR